MKNADNKQKRKESYIGGGRGGGGGGGGAELAVKKTAESGVKHSNSDIIRLAVKEYLEKNN